VKVEEEEEEEGKKNLGVPFLSRHGFKDVLTLFTTDYTTYKSK
jgi:hypothetical protein